MKELAASQQAFARALTDPERPMPAGVSSCRGEADERRFAVYRNNVTVGLTRALAKRFAVTERLVGADFFAGMARDYVRFQLPLSPLLFEYGDGFPDFIEAFEAAASVPYLADVARIEAAWTQAYHAEDAEPMTVAVLAAIRAEELAGTRLKRHPAAALVHSQHPIGSIWGAHNEKIVEPPRAWRAETVLVTRPAMDVKVHVVPPRDIAFAAALFEGQTLGQATATAPAGFDFGPALVGLVSLGAFGAVRPEGCMP